MKKQKLKRNKKILHFVLVFFIFIFSFLIFSEAEAATLYFSPSSGTFTVGDIFNINVLVNSEGQAINVGEAKISFPTEFLEVVSINKNGSIFSLWPEEPSFSNFTGNISFVGGLPTPGFNGSAGKIINIVFRAKKGGIATLIFSSGAVRADDGYGTDVLKTRGQAQFTLVVVEAPLVEVPPSAIGTPSAPKISSPTHPDSNKWYSNNNPKFVWEVPIGITGVKLLYNKQSLSIPSIYYPGSVSERQLENIPDGVYYFHVQLQNKAGWGGISHFKFQIDTQPPRPFKIEVKEGNQTTNPQPTLFFSTNDETSGIDHYEVIIDGKEPIKTEKGELKIPSQDLGKHNIIVKAVDKAGNGTLAMVEIEILPIEAPIITDYPKELIPGNILSIKGIAISEATIIVSIRNDKGEIKKGETKSDKEGKWTFIEVEPLKEGVYKIWAEAVDMFGAKSKSSNVVTVLVTQPAFIRIGKMAISYLITIITLFALIFALIIMILWFLEKKRRQKKRLKKEISEAEKAVYQAFKALKEEVEEQVAKLDGMPGLSEREKKISDELKDALKTSEKFINKEIKDIEKEMEK